MSTTSTPDRATPYALHLFGGIRLLGPEGPVEGRAAQRRQLAVLAVVAVAGGGLTRDRLLGLLWGDTTERRARHHLSDALYFLHKQLGDDAVVESGGGLSLNPGVVWCDVVAFEQAVGQGDPEAAVALYAGPLLDGFHVDGVRSFDEWMEAGRQRYARAVEVILEDLARTAAHAGDFTRATGWWQRLVALDPYNSRAVLALMQARVGAGDPANALHHLADHTRLLREQLDIDPDADLVEYGERLRRDLRASGPSAPQASPLPSPPDSATHTTAPRRAHRRWRSVGLTVGIGIAVVVAVVALRARTPIPLDPDLVTVLPFSADESDSALRALGTRMPDLMAGAVAGLRSGVQVLDPNIMRSRREVTGGAPHRSVTADGLAKLGRAFLAGGIVSGSVVRTADGLHVTATLYDVRSGRIASHQTVHTAGDEAGAAAALLVRLIAEWDGEPRHRIPSFDHHPAAAVLTYLAARREPRGEAAKARAREALRLDSTFAYPALEWFQRNRLKMDNEFAEAREAAAALWARRAWLVPEDRAYVDALIGGRFDAASDGLRGIARWKRAANAAPEWAPPWAEYAGALMAVGQLAGVPDWRPAAHTAMARVLQLTDSTSVRALRDAFRLALAERDTAGAGALLRRLEQMDEAGLEQRWAAAVLRGDHREAERLERTSDWPRYPWYMPVTFVRMVGRGGVDADRVLARGPAPDASRGTSAMANRAVFDWYAAYYWRERGYRDRFLAQRPFTLGRQWKQVIGETDPVWVSVTILRDALYLDAPVDEMVRREIAILDRIADGDTVPPPPPGAIGIAHCWRSQWRLANGDTAGVDAAIHYLRDLEDRGASGEDPEIYGGNRFVVCPALLSALRDRVLGRDARASVHALDSILRPLPCPQEGIWFVTGLGVYPTHDFTRLLDNLLAARLLTQVGDTGAALAAARRRPTDPVFINLLDGWLVDFLRLEGLLAGAVGDTVGAVGAYEYYLGLREFPPDYPPWRAQWDSVRAELQALQKH